MPLDMTPLVLAGSTAPVTLAGALAQQNAEVLGSLFIIYAMTGKIAKYVGSAHSNDLMHSMMCSFGSPNQALFGIATAQMAAFYGLTSGSNSGLTDALYPDFQVGFEKSFSAVCSVRRSARRPSSRKTAPMSRSSTAHSAQCSTRSCRMRYLDA